MKIWLNGEEKEVEAVTVAQIVHSLRLPVVTLLVEHNGLALRRDEWELRSLHPGDRLEIIKIVAGG
jgi:sulfur carrier protein